ncbi:S-layer family protein domain containing protein [Sporosarcina newyorkensis 2681]|uniref:S-layer family protein domain containing protein n=1 Tax=Sporosarcina newyorkensis 2681 TaxID=1027292 RepID=F9DQZ5_9BACL|nr:MULTISPECIES: S-layer homology domain-containing protein [Sporosarcina]EGQ26767.1 S-layer family protein domain containing protein [Sporosarcina newyorkensis 2681]MBY0221648.1 S-layer homology domain-containing protein [Sporosarcina aquimarina]
MGYPLFLSKVFILIVGFMFVVLIYSIQPLSISAATTVNQKQTYWYSDALQGLVANSVDVLSNKEGFYPSKIISRGEFAQLIYESQDSKPIEEEKKFFIDVQKEDPYYAAVITLAGQGAFSGYSDGTFRPANPLTRAQMAFMVSKAYDLKESDHDSLPFSDIDQNHWAFSQINKLYHAGIIKGNEKNQYAPNQHLTWAHAVGIVYKALQYEDEPSVTDTPSEEITITDVIALSSDGRYLEVTFSHALNNIDTSQFQIHDAASRDLRGIQEVQLTGDGKRAILTMFDRAGLDTLRDYTIQFQAKGVTNSFSYYRNEYIPVNQLKITAVDVTKRKITVTDDNKSNMTLTVPQKLEMDFVAAYNREVKIWHNRNGELTSYEFENEEKDVKKKSKFIGQYELDDFLLTESVNNSIIKGMNREIDLKDFDVFVKSHKMIGHEDIQQGDLLLFNNDQGVMEVCTNIVTGKIEAIYDSGIKVAGKVYDYDGYYIDSGKFKSFNVNAAEDIRKNVTLFLSKDNDIILVTY